MKRQLAVVLTLSVLLSLMVTETMAYARYRSRSNGRYKIPGRMTYMERLRQKCESGASLSRREESMCKLYFSSAVKRVKQVNQILPMPRFR